MCNMNLQNWTHSVTYLRNNLSILYINTTFVIWFVCEEPSITKRKKMGPFLSYLRCLICCLGSPPLLWAVGYVKKKEFVNIKVCKLILTPNKYWNLLLRIMIGLLPNTQGSRRYSKPLSIILNLCGIVYGGKRWLWK